MAVGSMRGLFCNAYSYQNPGPRDAALPGFNPSQRTAWMVTSWIGVPCVEIDLENTLNGRHRLPMPVTRYPGNKLVWAEGSPEPIIGPLVMITQTYDVCAVTGVNHGSRPNMRWTLR